MRPQKIVKGPPPRSSLKQSESSQVNDVDTQETDPDDARKRYDNMMGSYYDDSDNGDDGM